MRAIRAHQREQQRSPAALPPNTKQQKVWTAMRILRTFTLADLAATTEVCEKDCYRYVHPLMRAGYVAATRERSLHRRVYRLVRNTGPRAPGVRRLTVTDRNDRTVHQMAPRRSPRS